MLQLISKVDLSCLYFYSSHGSLLDDFLELKRLIGLLDHHALLYLSLVRRATLVYLVLYFSDAVIKVALAADD